MMLNFLHRGRLAGLVASMLLMAPVAHAVTVSSAAGTPTPIGPVVAGQSYTVTATGTSNLLAGYNGGLGLTFTADGKPTYAFPAPYAAFFPSGLDYDPSVGPTSYGTGGPGKLFGALLGTFSAVPASPAAYFTIGLNYSFTAASTGVLYALINDSFYGDNAATGYSVTLVPEPQTLALWLLGLGGLAGCRLRQGRSAKAAGFAALKHSV